MKAKKTSTAKWLFEDGFYSVETDDNKVVFYTDEIQNKNVVHEVVKMHNNGNSDKIDNYLLNCELCTQEEREIIVEGIYNVSK